MTEQATDRVWSSIDMSNILAGALAAVCAAVLGSFLGVAGTVVGAALASVVGSIGTEIYVRSIRKGRKKLGTIAPTFIRAPAAVGTPQVEAATPDESPSHIVPPKRQIRWRRVALIAGALFVLAMGSLTVVELIMGQSLASKLGNSTHATTTFGGLVDPGTDSDSTPAPTPTSTSVPTTATTTATTTEAPSDITVPTTAPTPGTPQEAPASGSSGLQENQGADAPVKP